MQQRTKGSFKQVLVLWQEHRKKISTEIKKLRLAKKGVQRIQQRIGLIIFGSMFVALGIMLLMLLPEFRRLFGESAESVLLTVFTWAFLCMVFLGAVEPTERLVRFLSRHGRPVRSGRYLVRKRSALRGSPGGRRWSGSERH